MAEANPRLVIPIAKKAGAKKTGAATRSQPWPRGGSGSCRSWLYRL